MSEERATRPRVSVLLRVFEVLAAVGVMGYLVSPWRTGPLDVSILSVSCLLIFVLRGVVIPPKLEEKPARAWMWALGIGTVVTAAGHWILGIAVFGHEWRWSVLVIFLTYLPFAWIQQYATLRYLVQRLCHPLARGSELWTCVFAGLAFGVLHWPFRDLVLPTMAGGALWTLFYLRSGKIWPLALSHAVTGTSLICGFYGRDPFASLYAALGF